MTKILLYIIVIGLFVFDVLYSIALFTMDLFPENSLKVVLVGIIAITLLLVARRISEKYG